MQRKNSGYFFFKSHAYCSSRPPPVATARSVDVLRSVSCELCCTEQAITYTIKCNEGLDKA